MFRKLSIAACAMAAAFGAVTAQAATFDFTFFAPMGYGSTDNTYVGSGKLFADDDGAGGYIVTGASGTMMPEGWPDYVNAVVGGEGRLEWRTGSLVAPDLSLDFGDNTIDFKALPSTLGDVFYNVLMVEIGTDRGTLTITPAIAAVPEPATWVMMLTGFGLTGLVMRRRRIVSMAVRFA